MKLKMNLDKRTFQEFFLHHTEKLVFAGFAVCFVALVYGAWGWQGFGKTPDQLAQAAQRAEQHIEQTEPSETALELDAPDYTQIVAVSRTPLKVEPYSHDKPWDPPLWQQRRPRGEPPLFAVQELRGKAGVGPFEVKQEAGADVQPTAAARRAPAGQGGVLGQRWAVVTGLVPVKRQTAAFDEYFKEAQQPNPETDVPEYYWYRIERAEATASGSGAPPQWEPIHAGQRYRDAAALWSRTVADVVDARYLHQRLVFPLGPRIDPGSSGGPRGTYSRMGQNESPWGEEVAHPPEIPLRTDELEQPPDETPDPVEPDTDTPVGDLPFGQFGRAGERRGGGADARRPVGRRVGQMPGSEDEEPEFLLFRFFDFDVEPGKSYRYRVRLMLENPNFGVDARFLETEELGKIKWIETGWSAPTEVISIPRDTRMLAVDVSPSRRPGDDPSATLLMVQWMKDNGREAQEEFDGIGRGQVLNFPGRPFPPDEKEGRPRGRDQEDDEADMLGRRILPPDRTDSSASFLVDYLSDAMVLDLRGGQGLPGRDRLESPGEILLLDADGSLVVRNEVADFEEYRERTVEEEPEESERLEPGRMPLMGEEGLLFRP